MSIESAEESCRRFLETDSTPTAKAYFCLCAGQEMERQQNYEAAIACYSLAFGLTPGTDDVWYFLHNNLGFCLNHFEKYEEAEPYCRQAVEMYPARHNAYKNLGISLQGQAQYLAAAEQFLKAVLICSNDPRALSDLKLLGQQHPEIPPLDRGEV